MIKRLSILCMLLLALCSLTFVSCSDDDDDSESNASIVGTWVCVEKDGKYTHTSTATFNADKTFLAIEEDTGESATYKIKGTYSVNGSTLSVIVTDLVDPYEFEDEEWHKVPAETTTTRFEIKGDKLYLLDGESGTVVYTRK